jgi:hypothetical protein
LPRRSCWVECWIKASTEEEITALEKPSLYAAFAVVSKLTSKELVVALSIELEEKLAGFRDPSRRSLPVWTVKRFFGHREDAHRSAETATPVTETNKTDTGDVDANAHNG